MRRATTPTHRFILPFGSELVAKFLLTYTQDGQIILEKHKEDMDVTGNIWSVTLSQEETKLFQKGCAFAQIRYLSAGGQADASQEIEISVNGVFNDEVLA